MDMWNFGKKKLFKITYLINDDAKSSNGVLIGVLL